MKSSDTEEFTSYLNSIALAYFTAAKASYTFTVGKNYPVLLVAVHDNCILRAYSDAFPATYAVFVDEYRSSLQPSYPFQSVINKSVNCVL